MQVCEAMLKYHSSPAMVVALLALFIAMGGVGYAASDSTSSPQQSTVAARQGSGKPGKHAAKAVPGLTRAYALVTPPCGGCAKLPRDFSPISRTQSMNVTLGSVSPSAPVGTWCFVLGGGINPTAATIVTSVVNDGGPRRYHFLLETAQWVAGGSACSQNQIEVQTLGYIVEGGSLIAVPNHEIAFSFSVDSK